MCPLSAEGKYIKIVGESIIQYYPIIVYIFPNFVEKILAGGKKQKRLTLVSRRSKIIESRITNN
jgi:hypothetical protein